jgi:hypothetical protein
MALDSLASLSNLHWEYAQIELVFDQHQQYGPRALEAWRWLQERGVVPHITNVSQGFSSKSPPLQAADMIAYECFQYAKSRGGSWRDWPLSNLLVPQARIDGNHFDLGMIETLRDANPPPWATKPGE